MELPHVGAGTAQSVLRPGEERPLGGGKPPQLGGQVLHLLLVQPVLPAEGGLQLPQAGGQGAAIGAQVIQAVQHGANLVEFSFQCAHSCLCGLWVYVSSGKKGFKTRKNVEEINFIGGLCKNGGIESIIKVLLHSVNPAPAGRCPFGGGVIQ